MCIILLTVAWWVKAFKEGQQNVTDMPRPGYPAWQCKGACSRSSDWFVESLRLGSALPPPYSPDLSPCNYDLFPKMKESLRGTRFRTVHDFLQTTDRSLHNIQRLGSANGIQWLPHRNSRCSFLGFMTLLTSQVISIAFYSEREKSDKFCSKALIWAWGFLTCRKSMTRDPWLYFPSEGSHTQDFYALKKFIDPGRVWSLIFNLYSKFPNTFIG